MTSETQNRVNNLVGAYKAMTSETQLRVKNLVGAYNCLHDARAMMTQSLPFISDGVDRERVLAAMEKADSAQKLMHDMALEIYKAEEDAR